jgi:hypothetical protein
MTEDGRKAIGKPTPAKQPISISFLNNTELNSVNSPASRRNEATLSGGSGD